MMKNRKIGFQSALLVSPTVIGGSFLLSVLAWWLAADEVAAVLLTLCVIGAVARAWGSAALKQVEVEIDGGNRILEAGSSGKVSYRIRNGKLLPLVWLELSQKAPKNGCMEPDETFTLAAYSKEEADILGFDSAYLCSFSFLPGHREVCMECTWYGKRRGVYPVGEVLLRSGDAFGLTEVIKTVKPKDERNFVVWPERVPVQTTPFLKSIRNGQAGKLGYTEDMSLLADEREYLPGDSWKRIDWRVAARTEELYTKQYEKIRPGSILFALDLADVEAKEDAISLTASLILELTAKGLLCYLALPGGNAREPMLVKAEEGNVEECMFALSALDESDCISDGFDRNLVGNCLYETGQLWIIGKNYGKLASGKLARLFPAGDVKYLCEEPGPEICFSQIRAGRKL